MSYLHWTFDAFSAYPELYNPKPNIAFFKHMKVWFAYIVTITHCKIKNVMDFVSVELSVKHDTQCPADTPDNHWANRKNRNYFYFHDSSQATRQTLSVMLQWQFYHSKIYRHSIYILYPAVFSRRFCSNILDALNSLVFILSIYLAFGKHMKSLVLR